jgi:hypothetical protein
MMSPDSLKSAEQVKKSSKFTERAMQLDRLRFTIRALMIAVLAVGVLMAMLKQWRDFLSFFVAVLVPLTGLIGLWVRVSPQRPSLRYVISAGMIGFVILGIGWLLARCMIWHFQRQEGLVAIGGAARGKYYEYWGLTVPALATDICSAIYLLLLAVACAPRRRRGLLPVLVAYAFVLAVAHIWLFADLEFEAFD